MLYHDQITRMNNIQLAKEFVTLKEKVKKDDKRQAYHDLILKFEMKAKLKLVRNEMEKRELTKKAAKKLLIHT